MVEHFRTPIRSRRPDLPPDATLVDSSTSLVWLSGVQSWDENDVTVGEGDAAEQVRVTMRNIEGILHRLGGALSDLAKVVIYVRTDNDANMGRAWEAFVEVMADHQPATTLVGVTMLGQGAGAEVLVEIEATAALPSA